MGQKCPETFSISKILMIFRLTESHLRCCYCCQRTGLICTELYVRVNFCNGGCVVLLQINKNYHAVKGSPYSEEHVDEGVTFLIQLIKTMRRAKPKWSKLQHLKGKNVRLKKMLVSL